MTKFTPLHDRVAIKPIGGSEKSPGGIIIPDTAQEKPREGEIVSVGNGTKDQPMQLNVGQKVLYGKWGGTEVKIDGQELIIMKQDEVLGVLA